MKAGGSISIWFFIGLSLLMNGALIFGAGLYQLHANIWWGATLFLFGAIYCYHFAPGRRQIR